MGRSQNNSHYKWHVSGMLDGITIDKKYLSIQDFLNEYGEKTQLKLNRHTVQRLRTSQKHPLWKLAVTPIKEKRTCRRVVVYFDDWFLIFDFGFFFFIFLFFIFIIIYFLFYYYLFYFLLFIFIIIYFIFLIIIRLTHFRAI